MNIQTPDPREAATPAKSSYRKTAAVVLTGVGLIAAIVIAVSLLPASPSAPQGGSTTVQPTEAPTTSPAPTEQPTVDALPTTVVDVPAYAHVLDISLRDGESTQDTFDGYSVRAAANDQQYGSWGLGVEVIDTTKGEYVSDLSLDVIAQDPTAPKPLIEGDPGAWTITLFPGEQTEGEPKAVVIITIEGKTHVAVGLGWGPIHSWSVTG